MHAYPHNLAIRLTELWDQTPANNTLFQMAPYERWDPLPPRAALEQLLSTVYQSSLLREEDRPVRYRLMVIEPEQLGEGVGAAGDSLQRLAFEQPVPFVPNELRRLAPAADFEQVLIGVRLNRDGQWEIWGLYHSGSDWIRVMEGSRRSWRMLPPVMVVGVLGAGHIAVSKGSWLVVRLLAGQLSTPSGDLFLSAGDEADERIQGQLFRQHEKARRQARGESWAQIDPATLRMIRRTMVLRIIHAVRHLHHGGTLLLLPRALVRRPQALGRYLNVKYSFSAGESSRSFYLNVVRLMNALAAACGRESGPKKVVGWNDYVTSTAPEVVAMDRAISDITCLIASASAVDGAVVLGIPFEMVGFGAEILGRLPPVERVARAQDQPGTRFELESTSGVGTRHRSAYRFCGALPEAVAVVVSQDGGVRLVQNRQGQVTYWEQPSFGAMMI